MALIQINVPDDVKVRADAAFARNGITTPGAMKMMVTQVPVKTERRLMVFFLWESAANLRKVSVEICFAWGTGVWLAVGRCH